MVARGPIRTTIERAGQPYVDEPLHHVIRPKPLIEAVGAVFGRRFEVHRKLTGYRRTYLKWTKPNG